MKKGNKKDSKTKEIMIGIAFIIAIICITILGVVRLTSESTELLDADQFDFNRDCEVFSQTQKEISAGILDSYIMERYDCKFNNESVYYIKSTLLRDDETYNKQFVLTMKVRLLNSELDVTSRMDFYDLNETLIDSYANTAIPKWFSTKN